MKCRYLPILLVSLLLPSFPGTAHAEDPPLRMVWMIHVDPSAWNTQPTFDKGRWILHNMALAFENHNARMCVATSWNYIEGCLLFGNGPAYPGSLGDLALRGHEIAYHEHGGVTIQVATARLIALTAPYTDRHYPQHTEGANATHEQLVAMGYRSGGGCGKDLASQLSVSDQLPFRPIEDVCYGQDPGGALVRIPPGSGEGGFHVSDHTDELTEGILFSLANKVEGKENFIMVTVTHPDDWVNMDYPTIAADMMILDDWLGADIDPLVSDGLVQWADCIEMVDLFETWEGEGGSNDDLFPEPNVTDPHWFFVDTTNSDLPADEVDEVFVDSKGRLWVGGGAYGVGGLSVLDGTTWTHYNRGNSDLRSTRITAIAEDSSGDIWATTFNDGIPGPPATALHQFDGLTWTVFDRTNSPIGDPFNFEVEVDPADVVWVGDKNGLHRYDGLSWFSYNRTNGLPDNSGVLCIRPEDDGTLWLGLRGAGVARLFHGGNTETADDVWETFDSTSTAFGIPSNTVYDLVLHSSGDIYAGTRRGLAVYDGSTWSAITPADSGLGHHHVCALAIAPNEDLLIATYGGGLTRLEPGVGSYVVYDVATGELNHRYLQSVAVDSKGRIYTASLLGGGISSYSPRERPLADEVK